MASVEESKAGEATPTDDPLALALRAICGDLDGIAVVKGVVTTTAAAAADAEAAAADAITPAQFAASGCSHLNQLVFNNARNKMEAFTRGAHAAVSAAMVAHRSHTEVQVHGCTVMKTLTFKAEPVKEAAVPSGILHAVIDALKHVADAASTSGHTPHSTAVAEAALTALCSICANHEGNTTAARESGVASAVRQVTDGCASPVVNQRGVFALALLEGE